MFVPFEPQVGVIKLKQVSQEDEATWAVCFSDFFRSCLLTCYLQYF